MPLGTWVGFVHCAARAAASRLQAQNQSADRTRAHATVRDFDAAVIARASVCHRRARRRCLLQPRDAAAQLLILLFLLDHVQRELLDFCQ